ncbi:hypothetical protein ABE096_08815 [Robertmurraya massiliosenegalensis]|uniref:hypothetical protein n=1 Tax=Robertmurraya TaxID=2837507 RepID=UPI0039A5F92A
MKENRSEQNQKKVIIPFSFTYQPLKKLALVNCEKSPDEHYIGLEPQYIDDEGHVKGYRVIAYRDDGYVDVYDEMNLKDTGNDDSFDVTGKGLCERIRVEMENTRFEKIDGCVHIAFQFVDKFDRLIVVNITEYSTKNTYGLNLLAPIGSSTEKPSYLPLFFLYNFDFVRKKKTDVKVMINGNELKLDNFPIPLPKDFQWRYYTRYSEDCQIVEFAKASKGALEEYCIEDNRTIVREGIKYRFTEENELKLMMLQKGNHSFSVEFYKGIPNLGELANNSEYADRFKISVDSEMGSISGRYTVKREGNEVTIELIPTDGWTPVPNSFFTKMMFNKKSVFCSWPKTYRYVQLIDLITLQSTSTWERISSK